MNRNTEARHANLGAFAAALLLAGCGTEMNGEAIGSLRLPLEAATNAGNVYRLQEAVFEVTRAGETLTIDQTDEPEPFVMVALPSGAYQISLLDGWSIVRVEGSETVEVDAVLLTENPKTFDVVAQEMIDVVFIFDVDGSEVPLGSGKVSVGFDIRESTCGNGIRDPNEECDPRIDGFDECDFRCTGVKSCTADVQCSSLSCEETCPDCPLDEQCIEACEDARLASDIRQRPVSSPETSDPASVLSTLSLRILDERIADAQCPDTCETTSTECVDSCNDTQTACILACGFFAPFCIPVCDDQANSCRRDCGLVATQCVDACPPNPYREQCERECTPRRCQSCDIAGRCPLLGRTSTNGPEQSSDALEF